MTMKKIGLGIAIILFAILIKLCIYEATSFALLLGLIGLIITLLGSVGPSE